MKSHSDHKYIMCDATVTPQPHSFIQSHDCHGNLYPEIYLYARTRTRAYRQIYCDNRDIITINKNKCLHSMTYSRHSVVSKVSQLSRNCRNSLKQLNIRCLFGVLWGVEGGGLKRSTMQPEGPPQPVRLLSDSKPERHLTTAKDSISHFFKINEIPLRMSIFLMVILPCGNFWSIEF